MKVIDKYGQEREAYAALSHTLLSDRSVTAQHPATAVSVVPVGTLAATNVQAALQELDTESVGKFPLHGVFNRGSLTLTYSSANKQFTITGGLQVYINGVLYTFSTPLVSTAHGSTTNSYFLYVNAAGALEWATSVWDLYTVAPLAYVYYDSTLTEGIPFYELHNARRDPSWHIETHQVFGTQVVPDPTTFLMTGYTLNSDIDASKTFALSSGVVADEDIRVTTTSIPDNGPYTMLWRTGATGAWTWTKTDVLPFKYGTDIQYNQYTGATWQLTQLTGSSYVNIWVYVTTSVTAAFQTLCVVGQTAHATQALATADTPASLAWGTLIPFQEVAPLYQLTYRRSPTNASTGKADLVYVQRLSGSKNGIAVTGTASTTAAGVSFVPVGSIASTDVQGAIAELDSEVVHLAGVETITGAKTFDLGTANGAAPTAISSSSVLRLLNVDSSASGLESEAYSNTGLVLRARASGGTRASSSATTLNRNLVSITGTGHDGVTLLAATKINYAQIAAALWTNTSTPTFHYWSGTPLNSVTNAEWMRLYDTALLIGTTSRVGTELLNVNGSAVFGAGISCTALTATAGSISVGNYGSVFIADSTDSISDIRIGIRPGASTTIAGLHFACNGTAAAFIDACLFNAGGTYAAARTLGLNGSGGGVVIGAYVLAGTEALRIVGGGSPGPPAATNVLIGNGEIKAGSLISCTTLGASGRATVDDLKIGDGSTYIAYLTYGSSYFTLNAQTNHGLKFNTNNTLALTIATTGIATFAQVPTVAGTDLVLTTDGRLSDARAPLAHSASLITSDTIGTARLGSGTANSTTFLRGDSTWVSSTVATAANNEVSASKVLLSSDIRARNICTFNYIENPDSELNANGWATYADAAAAVPADGTGGSPTVTWDAVSGGSAIRGLASFNLVKDAANRQGEGVSYNFTMAPADRGGELEISFDAYATAPYAAGDVKVFIYDASSGSLCTTLDSNSVDGVSVTSKRHSIRFTATVGSSSAYRLIFHVATTNANAYTLLIDGVRVGPAQYKFVEATTTSSGLLSATDKIKLNAVPAPSYYFWYNKLLNDAGVDLNAAGTATINRMHVVQSSTADFTITMPSASTNDVIAFVCRQNYSTPNPLRQYTLDAGAGVKIADRTRYFVLTAGSAVYLMWDNTAWVPILLNTDTDWFAISGGLTVGTNLTATTTNPALGSVVVTNEVLWKREGNQCRCRVRYRHSSAGTAGSGTYLFGTPFTMDSTYHSFDTAATPTYGTTETTVGDGAYGITTSEVLTKVVAYDSTKVKMVSTTTSVGSVTAPLGGATVCYYLDFKFKVLNW